MKTVRLSDNVVVEIIPDYALPVDQWYGEDFAAQCVEALDNVEQSWVYDKASGQFTPPAPPEPPAPDDLTMTQLAVAELAQTVEANNTANQLAIAELAETLIGGNTNGEAVL